MEDPFNSNNNQAGPQWHLERSKGIGGSDIGSIMGSNPYKGIMQLWEEKTGKVQPENLDNNYNVIRGKTYEPVARAFAEQKYGVNFEPTNFQHPSLPFCRASLDGYNNGVVLEIKCPQATGVRRARNNEVPPMYYDQIQWCMLASNSTKGIYQVYDVDGDESIFIPVERDEARINELITAAAAFWKCVEDGTPPTANIQVATDDEFKRAAEEFRKVKIQLEELEAKEKALKAILSSRVSSDNKEYAEYGVKITYSMRKANVDYKKVPELKGVNLEQYRGKPIEIIKIELV